VLSFRETAHGLKVLYRSGHLLEFAVFDPDELALARVNRYRTLLERGDMAERMARVRAATVDAGGRERQSDEYLVGMFLSNLLVGAGRQARGEHLSGGQFVKAYAVRHLVTLAARHLGAGRAHLLDDLDPFRRFELALPAFGEGVDAALALPTPDAALALLDLARRELGAQLAAVGGDAVAVVASVLADARDMKRPSRPHSE
jgi:hypothetical protein